MRKTLLLLLFILSFISDIYADTSSSTTTWNGNIINCPNTSSHGITHYGVPTTNNFNVSDSGTLNCTTHSYYSSSDHPVSVSGITACPAGERAISGNSSSMTCRKFDDIPPSAGHITSTVSNNYHLATTSGSLPINVATVGGAPTKIINGEFEKYNDMNGFNTNNSTSSSLNNPLNISIIDGLDKNINNYRDYTSKVNKVCDEAGNCLTGSPIKSFIYHVYANDIDTTTTFTGPTTDFTNGNSIADGTTKIIIITLKDEYGNLIVPVDKSGGTPVRNVILTSYFTNTLYLNQFEGTGDSGVSVTEFDGTTFSAAGADKETIFADVSNNEGNYDIKFNVYSPTYDSSSTDGRQFARGYFTIDSIIGSVSDISGNKTLDSNIDFQFKPLYVTDITGGLSPTGSGFEEGTTQTGVIDLTKNNSLITTVDNKIFFVQTGSTNSYFTSTGKIDTDSEKNISKSGLGTEFITETAFGVSYILQTLFNLLDGIGHRDDIVNINLKEYIQYNLGGNTITYLAGILNGNNTQSFTALKIFGISEIDSSKQKDLTSDNGENDIHILNGQITKSNLKKDMRKSAIETIKFVEPSNGTSEINDLSGNTWSSSNGGKNLGDILYFSGGTDGVNTIAGGNIILNNISTSNLEGKKTIIVKGGNLYIKSNIIKDSTDAILGIIVLKDKNGKGGNIYIDTNVQEIDAIIYADKSIISYNTSYSNGDSDSISEHEVDSGIGDTTMRKQLYILGSVFSENTIGGSRIDPPVCPFYTKSDILFICDRAKAQRYDLNYLRQGFENKYNPSYDDYPIIIKYDSRVQITPPPLFDK